MARRVSYFDYELSDRLIIVQTCYEYLFLPVWPVGVARRYSQRLSYLQVVFPRIYSGHCFLPQ